MQRGFVYYLAFCLEFEQSPGRKAVKNICLQLNFVLRLSFHPGLALTGFRTARPSSADTLFLQVSIDHNINVQFQRRTLETKAACLFQPISWNMHIVVILGSSVVVRKRPRAIRLAMITMRKSIHGFLE